MCGRYALHFRPSEVREHLASQNMPSEEAPPDDETRQTYNFAPSNHGLIYRAVHAHSSIDSQSESAEPPAKRAKTAHASPSPRKTAISPSSPSPTTYKLQSAKWGLIPFWTKRAPDYTSQLRTINCRDDSLAQSGGMWNTMKQRKRCIVVAEGFYEWLKKGKEKVPHFVKRKDGALMCMAGLWDCVRYEGSEQDLWTYTVITTSSNEQLRFLHDRMPVILEPGSKEMLSWLDSKNIGWNKELQNMLKPFEGELECYAVDKGVGKVGNNSPQFVVPVDSKDNPKNIANFFGAKPTSVPAAKKKAEIKQEREGQQKVKQDPDEDRETDQTIEGTEDNAPVPVPLNSSSADIEAAIKPEPLSQFDHDVQSPTAVKSEDHESKSPEKKPPPLSAEKKQRNGRKMRSAVSNETKVKTPTKDGNQRIEAFFGKT